VTIFFNAAMGDVGMIILDDIRDESVLVVFQLDLIQTEVHCPVLGVQEKKQVWYASSRMNNHIFFPYVN
jgi:hypothetical protein